jgi:hypothetical protein
MSHARSIYKNARVLLFIGASSCFSIPWAQTPGAPASRSPISRDVFLTLIKSSLNNACEDPQSPYACMVKSPDTCRRNLPVAIDRCERKMKDQLPAEIKPEETRQSSTQVARCIVDDYILLAGSANLDPNKCPRRNQ